MTRSIFIATTRTTVHLSGLSEAADYCRTVDTGNYSVAAGEYAQAALAVRNAQRTAHTLDKKLCRDCLAQAALTMADEAAVDLTRS